MTESETRIRLKGFIKRCGSQAKAAKALGVGQAFLSQIMRRERPISEKILTGLGIAKEVTYTERS